MKELAHHFFVDADIYNSLGLFTTWSEVKVGDAIVFLDNGTKQVSRIEIVVDVGGAIQNANGVTIKFKFASGEESTRFGYTRTCIFQRARRG